MKKNLIKFLVGFAAFIPAHHGFSAGLLYQAFTTNTAPVVTNIVRHIATNGIPVIWNSGVNIVEDGWSVGDGLQSALTSLGGGLFYTATGHIFSAGPMIGDASGLTNGPWATGSTNYERSFWAADRTSGDGLDGDGTILNPWNIGTPELFRTHLFNGPATNGLTTLMPGTYTTYGADPDALSYQTNLLQPNQIIRGCGNALTVVQIVRATNSGTTYSVLASVNNAPHAAVYDLTVDLAPNGVMATNVVVHGVTLYGTENRISGVHVIHGGSRRIGVEGFGLYCGVPNTGGPGTNSTIVNCKVGQMITNGLENYGGIAVAGYATNFPGYPNSQMFGGLVENCWVDGQGYDVNDGMKGIGVSSSPGTIRHCEIRNCTDGKYDDTRTFDDLLIEDVHFENCERGVYMNYSTGGTAGLTNQLLWKTLTIRNCYFGMTPYSLSANSSYGVSINGNEFTNGGHVIIEGNVFVKSPVGTNTSAIWIQGVSRSDIRNNVTDFGQAVTVDNYPYKIGSNVANIWSYGNLDSYGVRWPSSNIYTGTIYDEAPISIVGGTLTVSSNAVALSTAATNLHFWAGANVSFVFTNTSDNVDVGISASGNAAFPLTQTTAFATNYDGVHSRWIDYVEGYNSTSNLALVFSTDSNENGLYFDEYATIHLDNHSATDETGYPVELHLHHDIRIDGIAHVNSLDVTNSTTFAGSVSVTSNLTVNGPAGVAGNIALTNSAGALGVTINGDSGVTGVGKVFDVTLFGATGDGATDDTAAIQAAINAASNAEPSVVWFPRPSVSYRITSTINYTNTDIGGGIRLVGQIGGTRGPSGTIIQWDGAAGGTMFHLVGMNASQIEQLEFWGNSLAKYLVHLDAAQEEGGVASSGNDFYRCTFTAPAGADSACVAIGHAMYGTNGTPQVSEVAFRDCQFTGDATVSDCGVVSLEGGNVKNFSFYDCVFSYFTNGVRLQSNGMVTFHGLNGGGNDVDIVMGTGTLSVFGGELEASTKFLNQSSGAAGSGAIISGVHWDGICGNNDIAIYTESAITILNSVFVNARTAGTIPLIDVEGASLTNTQAASIFSVGNHYVNATNFPPFIRSAGDYLFDRTGFYGGQFVDAFSFSDLGGPGGALTKFEPFLPGGGEYRMRLLEVQGTNLVVTPEGKIGMGRSNPTNKVEIIQYDDNPFTAIRIVPNNLSQDMQIGYYGLSSTYRMELNAVGDGTDAFVFKSGGTPIIKIKTTGALTAGDISALNVTSTNGFLVKSNSWTAIPTLQEGDNWYGSSNGIPHVISLIGGVYTTNRLVP